MSALLAMPSWGQDVNKQALERAQMMLKKLNGENQSLQQQLVSMQQQLEASEQELADVKQDSAREKKKLRGNLDEWKGSHARLKDALQTTKSELVHAGTTINNLVANLERQTDNFNLCYANNSKMYDINIELLSYYNNKSAWDAVMQKEPVLGLKAVKMENMVQDYRYRLEDLNLDLMGHQIQPVSLMMEDNANGQ
ncbi:hypothetical protein [Oceanicoccus sp. KOV_DT_Chl]|uniref:hypothetical protein n=1 Tax=Oceanicoccus sp. KOV_DT_Chl TaxID=1904639 RepID=UPI0011AF89BD|nr:hypothetical protein [Oceanicoccus sp. KOV_DT_Chl]